LIVQLENAGESFAAGIDKHTGKNRWKIERSRDISWVTPQVVRTGGRDDLLLQSSAGLFACDPATGRQRWAYKGGLSTIPTPVAARGWFSSSAGGLVGLRRRAARGAPKVAGRPTSF